MKFTLIVLLTLSLTSCAVHAEADPRDWTSWRGPHQNNSSSELGLIDSWNPKSGENVIWKRDDLGSRSTPIVMDGRLYTICRDQPATAREGERVVCVDAVTGDNLWEHRTNVYLSDVPAERVGWSSIVGDPATGRVYFQSVCGYFCCLEGDSGKIVWERSLHEQFGLLSTYGGRTNFPLIFDDLVLVSAVVIGWGDTPQSGLMAKPAHRFMAFDKASGEMVWFSGTRLIPYDTTYSTPTFTVLGGQAAMVFASGDGQVWAMQPRTGRGIWNYSFSRRGINVSPLVHDGYVYASHSEENVAGNRMGGLVALAGAGQGDRAGNELWRLEEVMAGKSSPMMVNGKLWVIDDRAKLRIYDPEIGKELKVIKLGTVQRSTPLLADGKVYTCTHGGRWYILQPNADGTGAKIIHRLRLGGQEASDGSPIVAQGRIYFPTSAALYCLGDPDAETELAAIPIAPAEVKANANDEAAHVQVVPCEVLLQPGEAQPFRVRLFNERGQFLKAAEAQFTVSGVGEITQEGIYTAPEDAAHEGVVVEAKVGELTGKARLRIVPPLPWRFDFDDRDDVPLSWIGGRFRYEVRTVDGEAVMVKRDSIPTRPGQDPTKLGTRSRLWMGRPDLKDYLIQADVMGTIKDDKMPDVGLINQRYTLDLQGASQKVEVRTWSTQLRMAKSVPFAWEPNVWYTMKLAVEQTGETAQVRGKVWRREDDEPEAWTVEAVDTSPNLQGSPGLYGNAKDTEIYLDNLAITPSD